MKTRIATTAATGIVLAFGVPGAETAERTETGIASVYSYESGNQTASGQKLNAEALTAAHKTLPFGTKVLITNKSNGKTVVVIINDRGPFIRGRIIDVTPAGARALGFSGLAPVKIEVVS